jgi:hypothetical protein
MTQEEMIELIDSRVDYMTDVITDSEWFNEKVQEAVKSYLESNQL